MLKSKSVRFPENGLGGCTLLRNKYFRADHVLQYVNLRPGARILSNELHPFYVKTLQRYSNAPREGLWWYVQSNTFSIDKRCMRIRRGRRVKVAILEALKEGGFDRRGIAPQQDGKPPLMGTMEVLVTRNTDQATWEELKKSARALVKAVEDSGSNRWEEPKRRARKDNDGDRGPKGRIENSQGLGVRGLRMTDGMRPRDGPRKDLHNLLRKHLEPGKKNP